MTRRKRVIGVSLHTRTMKAFYGGTEAIAMGLSGKRRSGACWARRIA
jgi:hypothetical protein